MVGASLMIFDFREDVTLHHVITHISVLFNSVSYTPDIIEQAILKKNIKLVSF